MFQKNSCSETLENISLNFEKMNDKYVFSKEKFAEFDNETKFKFNFKDYIIAICPNGGLIAICKKRGIFDIKNSKINKNIIVTSQNLRTQYLIPIEWDYNKTWIVDLEFNDKEQLYAICNNGTIFKIDILTKKAVPKRSSSLFENEPIDKAKLFEDGFIALTVNGDFYFVKNIKDPVPKLFFAMKSFLEFDNNVDFLLIPENYSRSGKLELLITNQKGEGIIHVEQNENGQFYLLPVENSEILECKGVSVMTRDKLEPYYKNIAEVTNELEFTDETRLEKILAMAMSPNKEQIAFYNERGYVFLLKTNLDDNEERKRVIINLEKELGPNELLEQQLVINYEEGCQFLFCGEDAVALCGNRYAFLINFLNQTLAFKVIENEEYNSTTPKIFFKCISEIDGMRCLSNEGIYFISRVNHDLVQTTDPFSSSPAKKLINSYLSSQKKVTNSEKIIRSLKDKLSDAIYILQNAAMNIYWKKTKDDIEKKEAQLFVLNAAQHGKYYVKKEDFNFQRFYMNCKKIRTINNLRNNKRMPRLITCNEYDNIKSGDLIKFLVRCLDFSTASKICQYLEINIKYVYEKYAIDIIKLIPNYNKKEEEAAFGKLYQKLKNIPDFSFVNIAKKAFRLNKDTIGYKFLEKEKSSLVKIPRYIEKQNWDKIFEVCQNIYDANMLNSIFENIFFRDKNDKKDIIKAAGKFPKLKFILSQFLYKYFPDLLDSYMDNFKEPEELFFYALEQYFQSQKISDRKKFLSLARKNKKEIDINKNPNFDHKFYNNYLDNLESNLKFKLESQSFMTNSDDTSFDISIYDTYKICLKDKKNYSIVKSKNSDFDLSSEGISMIRFYSLAENGDFDSIDEILKNNYNNVKKYNLSFLNMAEIFLKFNEYDKAVKVIKFLIEPFYIPYKLDMMKYMNKYEDAMEIVITDKNIDINYMNHILKELIFIKPNLLQTAIELASKYKIPIKLD